MVGENNECQEKISISQIGYKSEWALAKFFEAYFNNQDINDKFLLTSICGRQNGQNQAINSLVKGVKSRLEIIFNNPEWRAENRQKEALNSLDVIDRVTSGEVGYSTIVNENGYDILDKQIYDNIEAIVIQSANRAHLNYIQNGFTNGMNLLCEKPIVSTHNNFGSLSDKQLKEVKKIIAKNEDKVLMDAEHYSYKPASLKFYENLETILTGENNEPLKIKGIMGDCFEIDKPSHPRTHDILDFEKSGTGLLGDTMCHLIAFVSNLNGSAVPIFREYSMFNDGKEKYNADTYDAVKFDIINRDKKVETRISPNNAGDYFEKDCKAFFRVGKFINLMDHPIEKESKFIKFYLNDDSKVLVDFKTGETKKCFSNKKVIDYTSDANGNEYVNILNHFYEAIRGGKMPITDFRNSVFTINSIFDSYNLPKDLNTEVKIYK